MAGPTRHERAREQSIQWMVDAIRRGDYVDAVQWLNTLAAVDARFTLSADDIVATWRLRASQHRRGVPDTSAASGEPAASDYRGLFRALLKHASDGIVISAVGDGWILECSDSFVALTGYPRAELLGRTSLELGLIEPAVRSAAVETTTSEGAAGGFETRLARKDGEERWVDFSPQLLPGDELLLTIVRDVTQRKRDEARFRQLADRDPLTNLFNRRRFEDDSLRVIADARRHGDVLVLLRLDLDEFKAINDRFGHQVGDQALIAVAGALRHAVREGDITARLGGDEFAAVLPRSGPAAVERIGEELERRLGRSPVRIGDEQLAIRASVGAAMLNDAADSYEALLAAADRALYDEKRRRSSGPRAGR